MRTDTPEYGWVELMPKDGGCALGISQFNPAYGKEVLLGQNAVITFTIDDIIKTKADFEKKGVTLLGDIVEVPGHVKMLFFTDLDGNKFQLVQMINSADKKSESCC